MNNIFPFVLFFLALSIESCKKPSKKIIDRFKDGTIAIIYEYPNQHDTSTYTYVEYYPKGGRIHKKVPVENNKFINYPTRYYPSGNLYERDSLLRPYDRYSDIWDGKITRYFENGVKWAEFPVKNGLIAGVVRYFDSAGFLIKQYSVKDNYVKNGAYEEFYPSGAISVKATFRNNLLNGMMYYFNENGDTSKYYMCDSGLIYLPYKKWLDNGNILMGNYVDTTETSVVWKWYSKSGKEIKKKIKYSKNREFPAPE